MAGAFEHLRVLDLSRGVAGPITTMFLADNGADVVRIESPRSDPFSQQTGYRVWNRGKRSALLDLQSIEGRQQFEALAMKSDVVVDSFSRGTTARLGIDHDTLSTLNPRIITCSITAYGEHSLHRDRPGYDGLVSARTGLLFDQKGRRGTAMEFINGRPGPYPEFDAPEGLIRGADREGPIFPRTPWPSIGASYFATIGIAAALRARQISGLGQRVTTSLLQGALAASCLNWQRVENPDAPLYWMWPIDSRSIEGLYECADGKWVHHWTIRPRWVLEAAEGDRLPTGGLDASYRDDPDRVSMESDGLLVGIFLHPQLVEAFKKFPSDEWVRAAEAAGLGITTVRPPQEALEDRSFLADGCVVEVEDPEQGTIHHIGPLLEFSETPGAVAGPAPRVGEHTEEVLAEALSGAAGSSPALGSDESLLHPLAGIRVLDLGLGVAGPFTGRVLADLGADVIKINALYDKYWNGTHMGLGVNRGKRSIALNLKDPAGREVLEKLLQRCDVITLNWRPGAAARLGLDYVSLRERYPRLIYCNTRGYEKGPRSDLPGTDQNAAAMTGTEWEDGACGAGNPPLWSRSNMGDTGNALLAAIAITTALYHRDRTGQGQEVSTSIVNAGLLHTSYAWIHSDSTAPDWGHVDVDQFGLSPYYRLYRCALGGWVFLAALTSDARAKLQTVLPGAPRAENDEAVTEWLGSYFESTVATEAFAALDDESVPVEIVDEFFCRNLFDDPEARRLNLVSETQSSNVGRFEDPGLLVNINPCDTVIQRGPCASGEQTRGILNELGYSPAQVEALLEGRAVLDGAL
jgi:crotonobetainyl-CoA:carnitine CoA-transferase CaiB-like acyl-CoA transferase